MPNSKRKRSYKKRKPFRDARLFFIVAEGDREEKYFSYFDEKNSRVHVRIIHREEGKSAPNHFIQRVRDYLNQVDWKISLDDQVWFVMDVDNWERGAINEVIDACQQKTNSNVAISNPCFEVWVLYHFLETIPDNSEKCDKLKQKVHEAASSGFHVEKVCPEIKIAMQNARKADGFPEKEYPDRMVSKVYKLANDMLDVLGENWRN